jgi:hypothetical protein
MNIGADQLFTGGVLIAKRNSHRYGRDPTQWLGGELGGIRRWQGWSAAAPWRGSCMLAAEQYGRGEHTAR